MTAALRPNGLLDSLRDQFAPARLVRLSMEEYTTSQITEFLDLATRLDLLTGEQADDVRTMCLSQSISPEQAVVQQGLLDPIKLDIIETLKRPTDVVPGYELTDVLGQGGMGVVYLARQLNLNRQVAIKTILIHRMEDQKAISRFEQEAKVLAQLSHPHIVAAYDYGRHGGRLYFVMEYIRGSNLDQRIEEFGSLTEFEAWGLARQAASGLAHAAQLDVVHRDIKPGNLLLVDPPVGMPLPKGLKMVKVADFGLARLLDETESHTRITAENKPMGSPQYMAPEQLQSSEVDLRADIYSLGATVYHMLAGTAPFRGGLTKVLTNKVAGTYTPLDEAQPSVSPASRSLVDRMMSLDPEDRPQDYAQLIAEIDHVLSRVDQVLTTNLTLPVTLEGDRPGGSVTRADATKDTEMALGSRGAKSEAPGRKSSTGRLVSEAAQASPFEKRHWFHWSIAIGVGAILLSLLLVFRPWDDGTKEQATLVLEPQILAPLTTPRPLFNGIDLNGWVKTEGEWRAVPAEGVIAGSSGEIFTTLFTNRSTREPLEFYRLECVVTLHEADRAAILFGIESGPDRNGPANVLEITPDKSVSLLERTFANGEPVYTTLLAGDTPLARERETSFRLERQPRGWFLYINGELQGALHHRDKPDLPEFRFAAEGGEAWFADIVVTALSEEPASP